MSSKPFDHIIGHDNIMRVMAGSLERPATGYLFFGPSSVGKRTLAEQFVRVLLQGSNECATLFSHPDFIFLQPEIGKRDISVKQARELVQRLSMTSVCGGKRVTMIESADRLTEEAGNALLKAVEDAASGVVFLFLSDLSERIPSTLRSRLVPVPFERVSRSVIQSALETRGCSKGQATEFSFAARGCPGIAISFAQDTNVFSDYHKEAQELECVMKIFFSASLGAKLAAIESLAKKADASDDSDETWRRTLSTCMFLTSSRWTNDAQAVIRVSQGLLQAWKCLSSPVSPRIGLEWAFVRSSLSPSFLSLLPSFLKAL